MQGVRKDSSLLHRAMALEEQSFSYADGKTKLLTTGVPRH